MSQGNRIIKYFQRLPSFCAKFYLKFRTFFQQTSKRIRWVGKNRGKIETVRPFEPSSTVVHPCTSVEGEFCAYTKHRYCMEPPPSMAVLKNLLQIDGVDARSLAEIKRKRTCCTLSIYFGVATTQMRRWPVYVPVPWSTTRFVYTTNLATA